MNLQLLSCRALAFFAVTALVVWVPQELYLSIFYAVLFGHYVMHVIYSKRQIQSAVGREHSISVNVRIILLTATFLFAQYSSWLPMPIFFGVHFLLSELYNPELKNVIPGAFGFRMLAEICIYGMCMNQTSIFREVPDSFYTVGMALGLVGILAIGLRQRVGFTTIFGVLCYEIPGILAAQLLPHGREQLVDIIFYHLIWWLAYPVVSGKFAGANSGKKIFNYAILTSVITLAFLAFTPAGPFNFLSLAQWFVFGTVFGNLHITLSFAVSSANPNFITRSLYGRKLADVMPMALKRKNRLHKAA